MRPLVLLASLLVAAAAAGPARAAPPSDLSADPLDRAALLALPSIYRVQVVIRVDGLRRADGNRVALVPAARTIRESGTAVAVAPGGWLVTAAHVAAPDAPTVARLVYQSNLAYRGAAAHADDAAGRAWVASTGARATGTRVTVRVVQADAGGGMHASVAFPALRVVPSPSADLALIQIDAPTAPALALDEAASRGTAVEAIGFGAEPALEAPARGVLEPAIRRGSITRNALLEPDTANSREAIVTSVAAERGDSGGPIVDAAGTVRGIVIERIREGSVAERATEVRQLLESQGVAPGPGATGDLFRAAMGAFWSVRFAEAEQGFDATLESFRQHTLAPTERARAAALADGHYSLAGPRRRGLLLGVGTLAVVAALACAAGLAIPVLRRRGRGTTGR